MPDATSWNRISTTVDDAPVVTAAAPTGISLLQELKRKFNIPTQSWQEKI